FSSVHSFFLIWIRRPQTSTLFPYTTLFRSLENRIKGAVIMAEGAVVTASDMGLEDPGDDPEYLNLRTARQRAEAQAVRQALGARSEEHTSELQSQSNLVCRLLLEKKKKKKQ